MTHYHCDKCNVTFTSNSKNPRCPDCNRVVYKRHDPLKPERKKEYKVKGFEQ